MTPFWSKGCLTKRRMGLQKEDHVLGVCLCMSPHPHPKTYVHPPPHPIVHKLYRLINTPYTPNSIFEDPKCCFTCFLSFSFSYFRLIAFLLEWNTGRACPASKPKSWGYPVQALCVLAWEDRLLGVCTYDSAHVDSNESGALFPELCQG